MASLHAVRFLDTTNSQVIKKTLFKQRYTTYIPDFFFIFFYVSLFTLSALLDRAFILLILIKAHQILWGVLFFASAFSSLIYWLMLRIRGENCMPDLNLNDYSECVLQVFLGLTGFDSLLMGGKALTDTFEDEEMKYSLVNHCGSYPFFHISHENLAFIKNYCYINLGVKVIPQLIILPIILLRVKLDELIVSVAVSCILVDMVIFSFTMAVTLPIRRTPRIFASCLCVLINSFSKFMATMCACSVSVIIFSLVLQTNGYSVFYVFIGRVLFSSWPCWFLFKSKPYLYFKTGLIFHVIFFTLIFSFIYIHPFEGKGKLFYYYFYLLSFVLEIAAIYMFSDADEQAIVVYFTLRVLVIAFISCFGLVNILHKGECKPPAIKVTQRPIPVVLTDEEASTAAQPVEVHISPKGKRQPAAFKNKKRNPKLAK